MQKMTSKEYNAYLSVIKTANDCCDKEALRRLKKQLICKYSLDNEDVRQLIKYFK